MPDAWPQIIEQGIRSFLCVVVTDRQPDNYCEGGQREQPEIGSHSDCAGDRVTHPRPRDEKVERQEHQCRNNENRHWDYFPLLRHGGLAETPTSAMHSLLRRDDSTTPGKPYVCANFEFRGTWGRSASFGSAVLRPE
jgi:hypothetical protein